MHVENHINVEYFYSIFCTTKPKLMEMKFFETIPSSRYQKDLA